MLSKIVALTSLFVTLTVAEPLKLFSIDAKDLGLTENTFAPGVTASMEIDVLKQAADVWFDTITQVINGLKIPDFDMGSGNYMNENTFYVAQRVADVELYGSSDNAIVLNCKQLTATFHSNKFRYHVAPLINAKGYVEVDMNQVDIGFGLQFKTQTSADGRQLVAVDTVDVLVNIDKNQIKLHIGGGFWTDIGSIFEVFFKGSVVDAIRDGVKQALTTTVPQIINKALLANDAYIPTPITNWVWDWESASAAQVSPTVFQMGVRGLMEDKSNPVSPPGVDIPELPYKLSTEPAKLQAYVSTWALDGFFASGLGVHPVSYWYNSTDYTNSTLPVVTTDELSAIFPGIETAYGTGKPVNIMANLTKLDNVESNEGASSLSGEFTCQLTFAIANKDTGVMEKAVQLTLVDTQFNFTAPISQMILHMHINTIHVDKITIEYCSWGTLRAGTMKLKLNTGINLALPTVINPALEKQTIAFPTHLGQYFILSDLTLTMHDSYIYVGLTPTFVGPKKEYVVAENSPLSFAQF